MVVNFWIIVGSNKSVRTTKSKPVVNMDEIPIHTSMDIPDAYFKRPTIEATIKLPEEGAAPLEVSADVLNTIKDTITEATGLIIEVKLGE